MSKEIFASRIAAIEEYERAHGEEVAIAPSRQKMHFMGEVGWINDPNGLIFFKGKYHIFYQYNPFAPVWGQMNWGHAISSDLIHWNYLPPALVPSEPYDNHPQGGCFSGTALVKDDVLFLFYTGVANCGSGLKQVQCVAMSQDGIHFEKYSGNPVLEPPAGIDIDSFRDPKVWEHDDSYYMICGARMANRAQALLYSSKDLFTWKFVNVMFESRGEWGTMWECPDFFTIGDKDIFTCSPIGIGDRTCSYFMGKLDYQSGIFQLDRSGEIDWGFDHYAAQTFEDSRGRRLMLSWANGWDWMPWWRDWGPTYKEGWCGSFTIPKEVAIAEDGELSFTPVSELTEYLHPAESAPVISCGGGQTCPVASIDTSGRLTFRLNTSGNTAPKVTLRLQRDAQHYVLLVVDFGRRDITVDRTASDGWSTGTMHTVLKPSVVGELDVDIIFDASSLEIFTQEHRTNFSFNVFGGGPWKVSVASDAGSIQIHNISAWNFQEHSSQSNRQEIEV